MLRYRPVNLGNAKSVAALVNEGDYRGTGEPLAAYLALPQALFGTAVMNLARAGLPRREPRSAGEAVR